MKNKELKILLSAPRGFCAGVERAIEIVEKSIQKYGAPVYVRHEIVHNKYVVDDLKNKGAIFVEELEEITRKFGDERRSRIVPDVGEVKIEDLIEDEEIIVSISSNGYIKSFLNVKNLEICLQLRSPAVNRN